MEIIFLGTGPVRGIKGTGKSKRFESSALVQSKDISILIDVTNDFIKQAKLIKKLDTILITHAHSDAIGGIGQLRMWQKQKGQEKIPLFSLPQTTQKIKKRFKNHKYLDFYPITLRRSFKVGDILITPFLVKHSMQPGFPTLGFHFRQEGNSNTLVYVSDVSSWSKKAEGLMKGASYLVIDGAMWGKKIASHLDIKEVLPKICQWRVEKIIFTQIGNTCPKHEILQKAIENLCPKASPAYDGMRIEI